MSEADQGVRAGGPSVTTPGGVPNLPVGALTLDTLASKTQDMSGVAMKNRAVERFPSIMDLSTGLSPALDITPFGILTRIWAEVNSLVANADPADITSPDDLPELVLEFIEGLPVVGQFVELFAAILGTYGGTDTTLLGIQALFAPIRALVELIPGLQQLLALVGLNTGTGTGSSSGSGTSNDPIAALLGAFNQGLQQSLGLIAALLGGQASTQAQIDAINSGGFSYDPAVNGVAGWTTLTGTALALSARGPFIQSEVETVAYRSSGLSVDKYGVSFVIDPTMRGVAGAAICVDSAGASWVGLLAYRGFDGDSLWLVSGDTPTLWVTIKQCDLDGVNRFTGPTTAKLKTDGVNQFWAEMNGHPVTWNDGTAVWTDSGALAAHNSTHRGTLLLSNVLDNHVDSNYGPAFKGKVNSYAA